MKKSIEIEASSLEEAITQLRYNTSEGLYFLSVKIISDGKPKTIKMVAETIEIAFSKANREIPANACILDHKELKQETITIQAFNEQEVRTQVEYLIKNDSVIKDIKLVVPGKKGLLGFGKKPNKYEVDILLQATVEINYKTNAKIVAEIESITQWADLLSILQNFLQNFNTQDRQNIIIFRTSLFFYYPLLFSMMMIDKLNDASYFSNIPFLSSTYDILKTIEKSKKYVGPCKELTSDRYIILSPNKIGRIGQPTDINILTVADCLRGKFYRLDDQETIASYAYDTIIHYSKIPIVRYFFVLPFLERCIQEKKLPLELSLELFLTFCLSPESFLDMCDGILIIVYSGVETLLLEIFDELNEGEFITDEVVERKVRNFFNVMPIDEQQSTPKTLHQDQETVNVTGRKRGLKVTACRIWKCPKCGAFLEKRGLGQVWNPNDPITSVGGKATCSDCMSEYNQTDVYGGMYDIEDKAEQPIHPNSNLTEAVSVIAYDLSYTTQPTPERAGKICKNLLLQKYPNATLEQFYHIGLKDSQMTPDEGLTIYKECVKKGTLPSLGTQFDSYMGKDMYDNQVVVLFFIQKNKDSAEKSFEAPSFKPEKEENDYLIFQPICLKCNQTMKELKILNTGLAGGPAHCNKCGQEYRYSMFEQKLTLERLLDTTEDEAYLLELCKDKNIINFSNSMDTDKECDVPDRTASIDNMSFPYGIGIIFLIHELELMGNYGTTAWHIFMKHINSQQIALSQLVHGKIIMEEDGKITMEEYCIGIRSYEDRVIKYIRKIFEDLKYPSLAPFHSRFIEKTILDTIPLSKLGYINDLGCLECENWTIDIHDLCFKSNWGYDPKKVPSDLSKETLENLKMMKQINKSKQLR